MPRLTKTTQLLKIYEEDLINDSISDSDLRNLMRQENFKATSPFIIDQPISDQNHSAQQAIDDFILSVAPKMSEKTLHEVTKRALKLSDAGSGNTFLRDTALEKSFLAYEMSQYPELAEEHFSDKNSRLYTEFEGVGRNNFKEVILKPQIREYTHMDVKEAADRKDIAKRDKLIGMLQQYIDHLGTPDRDTFQKTVLKHNLAVKMRMHLLTNDSPTNQISKVYQEMIDPKNAALLKEHRSGPIARIMEGILNVITGGKYSSKGFTNFFKTHGEVLMEDMGKEIKPQHGPK